MASASKAVAQPSGPQSGLNQRPSVPQIPLSGLSRQVRIPDQKSNPGQAPAHLYPGSSLLPSSAKKPDLHIFLVLIHTSLFGSSYHLAQSPVNFANDCEFFTWIWMTYYSHRGFLPTWFGLWRYSHCEFFKVGSYPSF